MSKQNSSAQNLIMEINKLWLYKWWVIGITLLGGTCALIYCMVVQPEYMSVSSIIPPNLNQVKSLNFLKSKFEGFGTADDEDLERIVAALKSDTAFMHMSKKYQLINHYELDDIEDVGNQEKLLKKKFFNNVSIKVTGLSTVQINVYDTDPNIAADMANEYITYADSFVESMAKRKQGIQALQFSIRDMENELLKIQDSMARYRSVHRLYHLDNMSEVLSQHITSFVKTKGFSENYDKLLSGEHRMRYYDDNISSMQNELVFRLENLKTYPSMIDVVSYAVPSNIKVRPNKMLTIALSVLGSLTLSILIVLYGFNNKKNLS